MIDPIPDYVDAVLQEWQTVALTAYEGFERSGRGAVGASPTVGAVELLYAERSFFEDMGSAAVVNLIDEYDPAMDFIVFFETEDGETRSLRVRTPEGGQHPKQIWFFEMLRRVTEEPDTLPTNLPAWFLDVSEKIEEAEKSNAPEA